MDNFFLQTKNNSVICDYALIRLNKKTNSNQKLMKSYQAYEMSNKDFIDIEDLIEHSGTKLCSGISKGYLMESLENNDLIITSISVNPRYTRSKITAKKLCGLIFLKLRKDHIFISLICGLPSLGKPLLNIVEKIAKSYSVNKIKLHSVDSAIGFYLSNGFTFDNGRNHFEISSEIDNLDPSIGINPQKSRKTKKVLRNNINSSKKANNNSEILSIGSIHVETRGNQKYRWIYVKDDMPRWKFVKPGYIFLTKLKPKTLDYILKRKPYIISPHDLKIEGRSNKLLNAGMISDLYNVNVDVDIDGSETIKMTKTI